MYVSNLSFNTGDTELNELFAKYGVVTSAKVITDRETGRSRGFGFVEMPDTDAAQKAMEGLNNKEVEGRPMNISEARAKTGKGSDNGYNSGYNSRKSDYKKW
jgi:RNA recognition motif-containing protein